MENCDEAAYYAVLNEIFACVCAYVHVPVHVYTIDEQSRPGELFRVVVLVALGEAGFVCLYMSVGVCVCEIY